MIRLKEVTAIYFMNVWRVTTVSLIVLFLLFIPLSPMMVGTTSDTPPASFVVYGSYEKGGMAVSISTYWGVYNTTTDSEGNFSLNVEWDGADKTNINITFEEQYTYPATLTTPSPMYLGDFPPEPVPPIVHFRDTYGFQMFALPTDDLGEVNTALLMANHLENNTDLLIITISRYTEFGWEDYLRRSSSGDMLPQFEFTSFELQAGYGYFLLLLPETGATNFTWETPWLPPTIPKSLELNRGWNNVGYVYSNNSLHSGDLLEMESVDRVAFWDGSNWATDPGDSPNHPLNLQMSPSTTYDYGANPQGFFIRSNQAFIWEQGREEEALQFTGTLSISEIMPSEGWFELYAGGGAGEDLEGYKFTNYTSDPVEIPKIYNLTEYTHIVVHTSAGETNTNASTGTAHIYLDIGDLWSNEGGEIGIYDQEGAFVDYVAWGTGAEPRHGWEPEDYLPLPGEKHSLSLQGESLGSDSYWTQGPNSPGEFNILDWPLSLNGSWRIHIINGRKEAAILDNETDGRWTGRSLSVNVSVGVPAGHPVNKSMMENVTEYVNFTYNLLKENGYGDALASGTDSEGRPLVKITITERGTYSGLCRSNGEIEVDLGSNRPASKQTVEHEMMHNFQFASGSVNAKKDWFIDEGMAEFWGRYSAMKNFNLTWQEIEEELSASGSMSIYKMTSSSWHDFFSDWPGTYSRTYYASSTSYYSMAFLFMKFLMDEYGIDVLKEIHEINSKNAAERKFGIPLIEKATGESFPNLLRNFTLYRLENRFPQYQDDPKFKKATPDTTSTFDGATPIKHADEYVEQYGSRINEYTMNGNEGVVHFKPNTDRANWQLTIIYEYPNGTKEYKTIKLEKGDRRAEYIPPGYAKITVIKTRLAGSNYVWEKFDISLEAPVITPRNPRNNEDVIWHPPPFGDPHYWEFWWDVYNMSENFSEDSSIQIEFDQNYDFPDPAGYTLPGGTDSLNMPEDIVTGTWWWRIRWELDGAVGPWTEHWNFTLWKEPTPPDIFWTPEPVVYTNETGNWSVIIPETVIEIFEPDVPGEITVEGSQTQIRIDDTIYNITSGEVFPLGNTIEIEHTGKNITRVEWRVVFHPFPEEYWPWYGENILWSPVLPEWAITSPEDGSFHNENTTMILEIEPDTPDGDWALNYSFNIMYMVDGIWMEYGIFEADENGICTVPLNITELPEGPVVFEAILQDIYGRISEPKQLHIEVDRTSPEVNIIEPLPGEQYLIGDLIHVVATLFSEDIFDNENEAAVVSFYNPTYPEEILLEDFMEWTGIDWTYTINLEEIPGIEQGVHHIRIEITDAAGNTGTAEVDIFIEVS